MNPAVKPVSGTIFRRCGLALIVLTMLLWVPSLAWLFSERWAVDSGASVGVIPLLISTVWIILTLRSYQTEPANYRKSALALLTFGCWCWLAAWSAEASIWQGYAMCLILAALMWLYGGEGLLRNCVFPLLYLPLAYPLPEILIRALGTPLRLWSAQIAGIALKLLGAVEAVQGSILTGPDLTLDVVPACSGLRTIYVFLIMGVLAARMLHRDWRWALVQVLLIPVATLVGNSIRIVGLGLAAKWFGAGVASGLSHEGVGVVVFTAVFFGLAVCVKRAANRLAAPTAMPEAGNQTQGNPPAQGHTGFRAKGISVASHAALMTMVFIMAWKTWPERRDAPEIPLPEVSRAFAGWVGTEALLSPAEADLLGRGSVIKRRYVKGRTSVDLILSSSSPHRRVVHEPAGCYALSGWKVERTWTTDAPHPVKWLQLSGRADESGKEGEAVASYWFEREDGWLLADGRLLVLSTAWERLMLKPERTWRLYSLFSANSGGGEAAILQFVEDLRATGIKK